MLGVNEVSVRSDRPVELIAALADEQGGHPLLVAGEAGQGRTVAWTSDIGPHWLSSQFCAWEGYETLWIQMLCVAHAEMTIALRIGTSGTAVPPRSSLRRPIA